MRPSQFLSSVFLFTALSAASAPWSESWHLKAVRDIENVIFERADSSSGTTAAASTAAASSTDGDSTAKTTAKTTAKSSASGSSASGSEAATTGDSSGSNTGTATGKSSSGTGTATGTDKSSGTGTTKKASTKTYGNTAGYGGISMITPNVYSSTSYYKVGDYVTFAWNYTSLSVTPSAVDILASCSAADRTYTIALNQSVSGATGAVTWDTGEFQATATLPLLTETYTLIIHDAAVGLSATPEYGHLSAYSLHQFGIYTPQPYSNTSGNDTEIYTCVTCKSAANSLERQTLGFLFGMVLITVLTFTTFAGGVGVLF